MLFDLLAWAVLISLAYTTGRGLLGLIGAEQLRSGDRFIAGSWLGIVVLTLALLTASLFAPLTSGLTLVVAGMLAVAGVLTARRASWALPSWRVAADSGTPAWAMIIGIAIIGVGAAALASDPVTLYDSLVYHVGIIRWLHEHGTVHGIALVHSRLGHVSAWFTLAAGFDVGTATGRTANIPLGLALVLVAAQWAIACARIAAARAVGADWFAALASAALVWAVLVHNAGTPSPDVATNALIVVVAWSMLVVPRTVVTYGHGWRRWVGPRLIPYILAVGACAMKLFALPAAIVAAVFYVFARGDDRGAQDAAVRAGICAAIGLALLAPFLAANLTASGCPLFPSPIGCLTTSWSIGAERAADYTDYIRDVARWESRQSASGASRLPWVGPWVASHPMITTLAILAPLLAPPLLRGPRRDGLRSALLLAVSGIAFAAWQAPAPRFLYAFVVIVPALALAFPLASATGRRTRDASGPATSRRAAIGFLSAACVSSLAFAVASQRVNVVTAMTGRGALLPNLSDFVFPSASPPPTRLYQWRVNDIDVLTPVPRPIADTLGYRSAIDGAVGFEKCSTAPLPCTPYLPTPDVHLRVPGRGLAGGFARVPSAPELSAKSVRCVGTISLAGSPSLTLLPSATALNDVSSCGELDRR